jgi:hypothetical protein
MASLGILKCIQKSDYLKTTGGGHETQEGKTRKGQSVTPQGQLSFCTERHFLEILYADCSRNLNQRISNVKYFIGMLH